jgi:hypothetical protein
MKHISPEKLDIYIINKQLLGSEAQDIEKHLNSCSSCKAKFEELLEFYKEMENIENKYTLIKTVHNIYPITISQVEEKLKNHKLQNVDKVKELFLKQPIKQSMLSKINSRILTSLNNVTEYFRYRKLAFGLSFTTIIILLIISIYLIKTHIPKVENITTQKIDTLEIQKTLPPDTVGKTKDTVTYEKEYQQKEKVIKNIFPSNNRCSNERK